MAVSDLADRALDAATQRIDEEAETYRQGSSVPVKGYAKVLAIYGAMVAVLAGVLWRKRRLEAPGWSDIALIGVATYQLSRRLAKDAVTSPLRAPFATYEGSQGNAEVREQVRGKGFRHAIGELVTCPFCLAQWIATGFAFAFQLTPRLARLVAGAFAAVTVSDMLQFVRTGLDQATRRQGGGRGGPGTGQQGTRQQSS